MSQQADAQRLPQDNVGGAFDLPEMEPSAAQPPPAFVEEPAADAAAERAKRRRGWLIVAAAILIPAGLASAVVAIVTMGTSEAPAPAPIAPVAVTQPAAAAAPAAENRPTAVRGSAATDAADTSGSASSTAAVTSTATQQPSAGDAAATSQANAAVAEQSAAVTAPLTPAEELAAWTNTITVEVAEGDTLWGFALQYGTTVEAIEMLNAVSADSLEIGAQITIPISFALDLSATPVVDEQAAGQVTWRPVETTASGDAFVSVPDPDTPLSAWPNITQVTVAPGDTLDAIAYDYGTSTEAIMVLSGITNPHELYPGDLLSVPVGYSAEVASVAVPEWTPPAAEAEAAAATGDSASGSGTGAATETPNVVLLPVSSGADDSASGTASSAAVAADELVLEDTSASAADELVLEDASGDELLLTGGSGAETAADDELLLEE